jgi:hypothetical protein
MKRLILAGLGICMLSPAAFAAGNACLSSARSERHVCMQETAGNIVQKGLCDQRYQAALQDCSALTENPLNPRLPAGRVDPLDPPLPQVEAVQPRVNPIVPRTAPVRPGVPR